MVVGVVLVTAMYSMPEIVVCGIDKIMYTNTNFIDEDERIK